MPLRVLIAPDKFKGTLTALEAAEAIARGWMSQRPADRCDLLPISDGGDGFGEVLSRLLKAERVEVAVVDAAHRPRVAPFFWQASTRTAILETAAVIGLALLPSGQYHPFELDTFGLGAMFEEIERRAPSRVVVGIGGSATNDGGFGLARALGWKFLNDAEDELRAWTDLDELARILPPAKPRPPFPITIAIDVQNRLLGPEGATRVYGPQKGLKPGDFPRAERCLERLAKVWEKQFGEDVASQPGTGAAGGLGFGLRAFLGGAFQSGFEIFAELARLSERLPETDLLITGEGAIDLSTAMGKGVGALAQLSKTARVPVIGLCGQLGPNFASDVFLQAKPIVPHLGSFEQVKTRPAEFLEKLAASAAAELRIGA